MASIAQKTHSGCKKRFKLTGTGNLKRVCSYDLIIIMFIIIMLMVLIVIVSTSQAGGELG